MNLFKKTVLAALLLPALWARPAAAQPAKEPSMLDMLGEDETTDRVTNAFKSPRAVNNHTMEMLPAGTMDFRILHRFGAVGTGGNGFVNYWKDGFYNFYGLDQATMRLGFDFGLTKNLMAGFGRSTNKKELDAFVKYRLLWQSTGKRTMPISLILVSGATRNGLHDPTGDPDYKPTFERRLGFYHEAIIGRKFSRKFTLQASAALVHQNLTPSIIEPNDIWAAGLAGRFKLTKRMAVVWDYAHAFNRTPANLWADPLSLGVDIETGGHVFQLHFTNAVGLNERAFIRDTNGSWKKGEVRFGFNLSRVFQLWNKRIG